MVLDRNRSCQTLFFKIFHSQTQGLAHNRLMAQRKKPNRGFTIDPELEAKLDGYVAQRNGSVKISDVVAAGLVIFFHDLDDADRKMAIDRARNYDLELAHDPAKRSEGRRLSEASKKRIRKALDPKTQVSRLRDAGAS